MAFLGGVLAFSLVAPAPATAQSSQLQEVRASAFVLVGTDGTTLARLVPGNSGGGNLELYDAANTQRLVMSGRGAMAAYDQDGATIIFRAGRTFGTTQGGIPPLNGAELGPGGSVSVLP